MRKSWITPTLHVVGRDEKWYSHAGKVCFFKKPNMQPPYGPATVLRAIYPEK